jgi:DNA-binding response OmpR family regulator
MRILLVEDEPDAAALLAKGLREQSYAVDIARDGETALEQAGINDYDLIILDVLLPGLNGMEICRAVRSGGAVVPILMLTARGGLDERVEGLDAGADDYLPKPYHFPELLDTRARRVERGGDTIQLTTKEYALLEYLARRKGDVVGRSDIAEHVWDDSFDPLSNLIEVYIQRLRRKVDDGRAVALIQTRRGSGYVLTADQLDADA